MTVSQLLLFFVPLGMVLCMAALMLLSKGQGRIWYAIFMAGYVGWLVLLASPSFQDLTMNPGLQLTLTVLVPMAGIAVLIRFGIPRLSTRHFPAVADEPRMTQEQLMGPGARREVLSLYFSLAAIGFIVMTALLYGTQRF